jgi:hypothetical protein
MLEKVEKLKVEKINYELERTLLNEAKKNKLRCKIKKTFHGTTGLLFNKRNYICEINRVSSDAAAETEYKRCLEWLDNYLLYKKAEREANPWIIRVLMKLQQFITDKMNTKEDFWKRFKTESNASLNEEDQKTTQES